MASVPDGTLPDLLVELPHWVVWRYEERDGKPTKVPYCVPTGQRASTTDPRTWSVYESAAAGAARYDGIGFVFSKDDDLVGVDLDDCRDAETGRLDDWAAKIVMQLDSYTEITPSGRGLHILCRGKLPPGGRRKRKIELYEEGRYFTITGQRLDGPSPALEERTAALAALHGELFAAPQSAAPKPNGAHAMTPDQWAIIERVLRHAKGGALWRGDTAGYESQSEAELALCGLIAFYAGPDEALIDAVMRQSSLSRDKWDSPRPGGTYGMLTIRKALSGKGPGDFYDWEQKRTTETTKGASVALVVTPNVLKPAEMPQNLAAEAYYGIPGRVMKTIAPHTESHPAGILCSFLTGGGALIGSRPHVFRDGQRHACNEFGLLMGKSGIGRKGTSSRRVEEIFRYSGYIDSTKNADIHERDSGLVEDLGWLDIILRGLGSGEALVAALAEENESGVVDPRRMVFEPEFARCLKVMQREGSTLSDMLKAAWDSEPMHVRTKGSVLRADTSHVSILAHVTEADLRERMANAELFNGFANRFLWFATSRVRSLPFGGGEVPLGPLVLAVHQALGHARGWLGRMEFDADAARIWGDPDCDGFGGVYDLCSQNRAGLLGAVTDRAAAHATRIALQYAVWDRSDSVRVPHLLAGLAVWDYSFQTCIYLFGRSTGDTYADLILEKLLEVYPGFLTRKDVRDLFARNAAPGRIPKALELLAELGLIERGKRETGGHPAEIIVLLRTNPYDQSDQSPLEAARKQANRLGYTTETTETTKG